MRGKMAREGEKGRCLSNADRWTIKIGRRDVKRSSSEEEEEEEEEGILMLVMHAKKPIWRQGWLMARVGLCCYLCGVS